jgi:hypothetical protein
MNYENVWQLQDEITASVNALGYNIWDLRFSRTSFAFHMELNEKVEEDKLSVFLSHLPLLADYEGEGRHGSAFTLYA